MDRAVLTRLATGGNARPEIVERVARACGGDVNEWRSWAGYDPIPAADESGHARFVRGLAELSEELGRPVPVSLNAEQAQSMTPEQAEQTLAVLRRQAEEGLF